MMTSTDPEGWPDDGPALIEYPPTLFHVQRDVISAYADQIGLADRIFFDRPKAQAAGFRDVVSPPTFVGVYAWAAMAQALTDPRTQFEVAKNLHAEQTFTWFEPVCAGDLISTDMRLKTRRRDGSAGRDWYVFESRSHNQFQQPTAHGVWRHVVLSAGYAS